MYPTWPLMWLYRRRDIIRRDQSFQLSFPGFPGLCLIRAIRTAAYEKKREARETII